MPRKNALQLAAAKGGRARAAALDKSQRSDIGRNAALKRWENGGTAVQHPAGCKCCGVEPATPRRRDRPYWCDDCRAHRTGKGTDRTYQAAHGAPCPYIGVPVDKRKRAHA